MVSQSSGHGAIFDLDELFEALVTADDVAHGKPEPEVLLTAVEPRESGSVSDRR